MELDGVVMFLAIRDLFPFGIRWSGEAVREVPRHLPLAGLLGTTWARGAALELSFRAGGEESRDSGWVLVWNRAERLHFWR